MSAESSRVSIVETATSFDNIIKRGHVTPQRAEELSVAKVLFLPIENFRGTVPVCFHDGTRNLFVYLKSKYEKLCPDLCVEKGEYKEISLHSDEIRLGQFLVETLVFPLFVSIVSGYVLDILKAKKTDNVSISIAIPGDNGDRSVEVRYEGSPKEMEEKLKEAVEMYNSTGILDKNLKSGLNVDEYR